MAPINSDYSNKIYDYQHLAIVVPNRDNITTSPDPEEHLRRINEISSPAGRLAVLIRSTLNPFEQPTHEASMIRALGMAGAFGGMFFGGFLRSKELHAQYIRLHNASVFEGRYRGNRHFYDTLVLCLFRKGMKYCVGCGLLMTAAGFIGYGSIVYRQKLYLPDFLLGSAAVAGATRLWLGPRAVLVGAGLGAVGGLIGYGLVRSVELTTGMPITHRAYVEHKLYTEARLEKRIKLVKSRERLMSEKFGEGDM